MRYGTPDLRNVTGKPFTSMTRVELLAERAIWADIVRRSYPSAVVLTAARHLDRCNQFLKQN